MDASPGLEAEFDRRRQARPESPAPDGLEQTPGAADQGPAAALERRDVQDVFLRLAGRLSPQQRAVFVLREMNDLNTGEIARIMEISASTVRNHLHQARKILRRGLAALYPEYDSPPAGDS